MAKKKTLFGSKILWENYFGMKFQLSLILIIGWLASISTFAITLIIGAFFELHFQTSTNRSTLMKNLGVEFSSLNIFFLVFVLIVLIKAVLSFTEKQLIHKKAEVFIKEIQQLLFKKQMFWSEEVFAEKSYGKYLLRFSGDMSSIKNMLVNGIHRGMKDFLFLITGLILMFSLNIKLTWIVILVAICLFPLILFIDHSQKPKTIEKRNRKSTFLDFVTRSFANHKEIGISNKRNRTIRKFNAKSNIIFKANLSYQKLENIRQVLGPTTANILVLALLFSIYQFTIVQISPGELLVYLLILANITGPLKNMFQTPGIIRKGLISLNKIEEMILKKRMKSITSHSDNEIEKPNIHQSESPLRINKNIIG